MEQRRLRSVNGTLDRTLFQTRKNSAQDMKSVVVVPKSELLRMQGESVIISPSELARQKQLSDTSRNEQNMKSTQRKERMMNLEKERSRRVPLTDKEVSDKVKYNNVLSRSREALDEELDDVKQMNQMAMYAKCATIRDRQVLEKQMMRDEVTHEERRLDTLMEIERIQRMREQEERDRFRHDEQKYGAHIIRQQIEERELNRLKELELRDIEASQMLQKIKEDGLRTQELQVKKFNESKRLLHEIKQANYAQSQAKIAQRESEALEDAKILEYIRRKDARELALEEEQNRLKAEREMEIARLRSLQEKALDRQSQIDELRAQRYQEQKERQWRDQELTKSREAALRKNDLLASREEQRLEKAKRMAEEALREREEYERVREHNQREAEKENYMKATMKAQQESYSGAVKQQMREREMKRNAEKQRFLEEGSNYTAQAAADKAKLLRIKELKLAELERAGVPAKYRTQLANAGK